MQYREIDHFQEDAVKNHTSLFLQMDSIFLRLRRTDEIYESLEKLALLQFIYGGLSDFDRRNKHVQGFLKVKGI
jgi:hypothetical protein